MGERENLLTQNMAKLFKKLSIPGMLGYIIIGLYNFVDAIFVGQLVGKEAVGAVAMIFSVVLFNQSFLNLVGTGSMSVLSISIGQNNKNKINKLLGNMLVLLFMISGIFSLIVYLNISSIVKFIGGKGLTYELGTRYLKILLIGFIPAACGPAMNLLVRAEGKMKDAMLIAGFSGILNIILDPIFIKVLGFGIEGAAIATVISQLVYMVTQLIYFGRGKSIISLNKTKLRIEKEILPSIMKVGIAQMIMCIMAMIQQILLYRALQYYGGNDHVSLMGASYRVYSFAFFAVWGIGQGLQSVVGVNYGAKKYNRVKEAFKEFTIRGSVISVSIWVLFMIFPKFILGWFIKDSTLVSQNVNLFRILNSVFFLYVYFATVMNLFIGFGKGKEGGIVSIARQIVFFIPLVIILPKMIGVKGVWIALPLADLMSMLLAVLYQRKIFTQELNAFSIKRSLS